MKTHKFILKIPESLSQQLENLAEASDQSTESLIINCITRQLPQVAEEIHKLDELLASITLDNLHGEIDFGEPVGHEFR